MNRLGIERLTLAAGLQREECQGLVDGLAGRGAIVSTAHAVCGRVQLAENGEESGRGPATLGGAGSLPLAEADLDRAQEAFLRFDADQEASVERLDETIWRLVESFDETSRALLLLAPMHLADERLFVHSLNVALLTLTQARALGIGGQMLHDIGLAALLHDIGKLSLPRELRERNRVLTDEEWRQVMLHPELGAAQLCTMAAVPSLAVLVAYEHHLRWDGRPSYPRPSRPRLPNLASQLTAIADTYDVMVASGEAAGTVYSRPATKIWQQRAGTFLDPFLVGNFALMVAEAE
jgi:HD-GYP domain-containing protein (c-di-GMP phosphodiesterase class II)